MDFILEVYFLTSLVVSLSFTIEMIDYNIILLQQCLFLPLNSDASKGMET